MYTPELYIRFDVLNTRSFFFLKWRKKVNKPEEYINKKF